MKIRCIAKTGADLPERYFLPHLCYKKEMEFQLTLGREYAAYAIEELQGMVWYYICDDDYTYYPMKHPAPLFEVVDNKVSQYWRFKLNDNGLLEIGFEEWISDRYFYDKLTDMEEAEVSIFEKAKELIDAEAASPATGAAVGEKEFAIR